MTHDKAIQILVSCGIRHAAHLNMLDDVAVETGGLRVHALEVQKIYKAIDMLDVKAGSSSVEPMELPVFGPISRLPRQ